MHLRFRREHKEDSIKVAEEARGVLGYRVLSGGWSRSREGVRKGALQRGIHLDAQKQWAELAFGQGNLSVKKL